MHSINIVRYDPTDPRLGRHVRHDSRSLDYEFLPRDAKPQGKNTFWDSATKPLNQGNLGSCTGNATAQWLNTNFSNTVRNATHHNAFMAEKDAVAIYSLGTRLDNAAGQYPPTDTGCNGISVAKAGEQLGYLDSYTHTFSFTALQAAIEVTPTINGTLWTKCVVPETLVLTTDLEWVEAQKLDPGAQLIGFDEDVRRGSAYRRATLLTNDRIVEPCVEITTDRGSITTSNAHLFVQRHVKAARHWIQADQLQPGDQILFMGDPWEADNSYEAGWLAGFYDGEGCLSDTAIGGRSNFMLCASQKPGPTLDRCLKLLAAKGFDYGVKTGLTGVSQVYLRGSNAKCRFLGQIRPGRLLAVSHRAWEGLGITRNITNYATVQEVKDVGRQEVVAIGTSTRTLVTDGFLSHNSMFKPVNGLVKVGSLTDSNIAGGHEYLCCGIDFGEEVFLFRNSWGDTDAWPGCKPGGYFAVGFADYRRLLLDQGDVTVLHGKGQL